MIVNHPNFVIEATKDEVKQLAELGALIEHSLCMYDEESSFHNWQIDTLVDWIRCGRAGAFLARLRSRAGGKPAARRLLPQDLLASDRGGHDRGRGADARRRQPREATRSRWMTWSSHGTVRARASARSIVGGDTALTPKGREQARALAVRLSGCPIDLCVTSCALRARQTACCADPAEVWRPADSAEAVRPHP